jgi:ferric-dicitrate binding protein FerR (iron transport regulator)
MVKKQKLKLPEKSTVTINAGSKVKPEKQFTDERKINLEGEAFFSK